MERKITCIFILMLLLITTTSAAIPHINNTPTNTGEWTEQTKLMASDSGVLSFFGLDISLDEDYALIGAHGDDDNGMFSGAAYIFKRTETDWLEEQKLLPSDGEENDLFGSSVALDEDYALIGQIDDNSPGAAYLFKNTGTEWVQEQKITAADGEIWDEFGVSVALDGDYAIIGAQFDDDIGSAYIFKQETSTWIQQAKLTPSDPELWQTFGMSVAIDDDTVAIGAWGDDDYTGAVYIFTREDETWTEEAKLTASDGVAGDRLGGAVTIQGDLVIAGARNHNEFRGAAYLFKRDGTTWTEQQKLMLSDAEIGDSFGGAVSIDENIIMIGAPGDEEYAGSAIVYTYEEDTWTETQKLTASDTAAYDEFGCCIALDENYAFIGKYAEDDFTGAAYVFSKQDGEFVIEIKGGLGVQAIITNNGSSKTTNVSVNLHVEGGILGKINTTIAETLDIPTGESATVSTGIFLGLGPIAITVEVGDVTKTAEGLHLIIFSLI